MSFLTGLALIFVTLKLIGVITWSWWIVLSPVWGTALFVTIITIIAAILETDDKRY